MAPARSLFSTRPSLWKALVSTTTLITFFFSTSVAQATTFFWAGNYANSSSWEDPKNWAATRNGSGGAGVPTSSDLVVFTTGTGSKSVTLKTIQSVGGFEMNNLWTGSILIGTGVLSVGRQNMKVGSGYLVMGNNPLSLSGSYTQTGGVVRGLMNTFSVSGSLSITNGGTPISVFTATGTVVFSGGTSQTFTPSQTSKFTTVIVRNYNQAGSHSVTVSGNAMALSGALTVARGRLNLGSNALTARSITLTSHASGSLVTSGNVTNSGSLTVGALASMSVTGGTWTFPAAGNQTVDLGGKNLFNATISNPNNAGAHSLTVTNPFTLSGALTISRGRLNLGSNALKATSITLTSHASGSLVTSGNVTNSGSLTVGALASMSVTGGTWTFAAAGNQTINLAGKNLFNATVSNPNNAGANTLTVSNPFTLSGALTVARGILNLGSNALKARGVTLNSHASGSLVTSGNVTNSGSVSVGTLSTLTVSGGTWTQNSQSNTTLSFNSKPIQALTINNTGVAGSNTETLGNTLNMSGALTVSNGTLATAGAPMNVTGNISFASTLNAAGGTITTAGNWTNNHGTFTTNGSNTVKLNGSNQILSGSTIFDTLTKAVASSDTLTFAATALQTTTKALNLNGSASNKLSLRSSIAGVPFKLFPQLTRSVSYLDVKDSNNTFVTIACSNNCTDSGGNTAWDFTSSSSDTSTTTAGTSGGGGGGGGGSGVRKTSTVSTPAPSTPGIPPKKATTEKMTLKQRIEMRKMERNARIEARKQARLQRMKAKGK